MIRLAFLAAALSFLAAPLGAQQDDPWETHLYNVEFLTRWVDDYPGVDLGLSQDSIGVMVSEAELSKGRLTGEDLEHLIKSNVEEDTWEHEKASITFEGGVLTITNKKSVHERIRQYLAYWRGFFGKMITIDATLLSIDPALFAKIRSAGNADRPMVIPPEHLRQVFEAAREGKNAEVLKTLRVTAHPGQRVNLQDVQRQQYVRDLDVQIASASVALDPVMDIFSTGTTVDLRPYLEPFGNAVTIEIRAGRTEQEALTERKLVIAREIHLAGIGEETDAEGKNVPAVKPQKIGRGVPPTEAKLELPRLAIDRVRTTLTARTRETVIAASTFRNGRQIVFLLTPSIVALEDKPAPEPVFEEQRLLRLYDISPLTRGIQDFAGPRVGLVSPSSRGGGPLTGATFTLEEPAVLMTEESVVKLLKTRIAPDTWGNKRNSLTAGPHGALMVRQKPEVLKEIDQYLASLLFSRAQMITCEAVLIGFRKGARLQWEAEIPALAPGGYFVEREKFDKLLEEAYKGANVRLVETAEITGFPQERVNVVRLVHEAIVADYEPQVSTCAAAFDPVVDTVASGFVFDVRPHFVSGTEQIAVGLRASLARHELREVDPAFPVATPLQAAKSAEAKWESDVLCAKGRYTLAGLFTRGKGDDSEDVALFLRARANLLTK